MDKSLKKKKMPSLSHPHAVQFCLSELKVNIKLLKLFLVMKINLKQNKTQIKILEGELQLKWKLQNVINTIIL